VMHGAALLACVDAAFRRRRLVWRDMSYQVRRNGDVVAVSAAPQGKGTPNGEATATDPPEEAVA
ncbi:MAG: hypothetical protein HKN12_04085, partial [Gemmatimonadetes bacterium]|nr:hypothetical protein [Gemmatimonadota bacterium]